jgi:tRNA 2-thiouridine synthesizing protein A
MAEIIPDAVLDVRGEACPYPFIRTKWLMEQIASGEVIKVVANNPDALDNIEAWTKKSGDRILRIGKEGDTCIIYVKKKG